uniref:Uncharacterized protein n=1 Tax=Arundo donax TaxID=35708 RepID=A0A0A9G5K7_ARUDO
MFGVISYLCTLCRSIHTESLICIV